MVKNKNTLLLDCAARYLPDEVVRYHVFQKFLGDDVKKQYVTLRLKDMLIPNSISLHRETSIFRKRLYALRNCNRYLLVYLMSMAVGSLMAAVYLLQRVILCCQVKDDKEFFREFLLSRALGVQIGDCVLSTLLRLNGSRGFLVRDLHFYKTWFKFTLEFFTAAIFARCLTYLYTGNKFFYSHETTYLPEAIRRILLRYGFREIRYDRFKHNSIIMSELQGHEIRKGADERYSLDKSQFDLPRAEKKLRNFVSRNETYSYMLGADVDQSAILDVSVLERLGGKKVAVIYLHAVSDAQYIYGTDCFTDLHDWLMETLAILEVMNIFTCVKMHPSYFNVQHNYPVDKEYLELLEEIFGISLDQTRKDRPMMTNRQNMCFLHHSVPIVELSRVFPGFLCVTHHGTVATEAAYLGHAVVCSKASPYMKSKDNFVSIYESLDEYASIVRKWVACGHVQTVSDRQSLFEYCYVKYFIEQVFSVALVVANVVEMKLVTPSDFFELELLLSSVAVNDEMFLRIEAAVRGYV